MIENDKRSSLLYRIASVNGKKVLKIDCRCIVSTKAADILF